MRTHDAPTHRLAARAKSTPRGRRRSPTTRTAPFVESLEDRTLLSSGQLDTTFGYQGTLPIIGAPVEAIVSDAEGRLLIAGAYALLRYSADGQLDPTFGSLGTVTIPNGYIDDVAVASDGKIVVYSTNAVVDRLYPDGSVDTSFGTDGSSAPLTIDVGGQQLALTPQDNQNLQQMALLPDGDIVVAGSVQVPNLGQVGALEVLLPDGSPDTSFNGTGTLALPYASGDPYAPRQILDVAINDDHILVFTSNDSGAGCAYQYNPDGTLDSSFGSGGEVTFAPTASLADLSMAVEPDGTFVLGGRDTTGNLNGTTELIARYNPDGTPDTTFGTNGQVTDDSTYIGAFDNDIAVQPDGKLILTDNGSNQPVLQRLNADGSLDTGFGIAGYSIVPEPPNTLYGYPSSTDIQPNGRILAADGNGGLYGIVGDPVVSFDDATSDSDASGTPTAEYDVPETAGSATITLTRGGDLTQPLSVPFSTDDSGGYGGVNYTPVNTTVMFPAGSATATVSVPILVDPNASPAVDIPLVLGTPSGGAVLGAYPVGDLHIEPSEGIVVGATQIPSVAEQGPTSSFTVALQTVPTGDVTVPLSISTTSPAASLSSASLVFTPADALTPQTVTVSAVSNSGAQGNAPAIATVAVGPATSTDPKYNGLAGGTVQVGVYDDGASTPGFIEFAAPDFSADETDSQATVTLERLGGSNGSVTVDFDTSDASSHVNGDYTPLSGSISFGPGVTTRTFSIAITDPGYNLDGDQTVDLTLSDPTGGAQLGVFPTATLTLHDPYTPSAGQLDPTFGASGSSVLTDTVPSSTTESNSTQAIPDVFAVLPDGNVILAGTGTYLDGIQLWEVTQAGQPVASFGQGGIIQFVPPDDSGLSLSRIVVEPDGSFVLAGKVAGPSGAMICLMELNPDGSLDTGFGSGGEVTGALTAGDDTLGSLILESDGSLLVGATLDTAGDASSTAALIHYEPDGSLDIGFGTGGVLDLPSVPVGFGVNVVQQPDGKLLFLVGGGEHDGVGNLSEVIRLDADDQPDPTFGTDGVAEFPDPEFIYDAIVQPDGKILISGNDDIDGDGDLVATVTRLDADGSLDTTFGDDGSVTLDESEDSSLDWLMLLGDGKILAIGNLFDPFGSDGGTLAACLLPDGSLDPSFAGGGIEVLNGYENLNTGIELPDGDILVAGGANSEPVMQAILTSTPSSSPAPGQEPGQLAFTASTASVTAGNTVTFTVDRTGGGDGTVTVAYTTVDGSAVAGTDYTAASGTLTFAPGVTGQTITVATLVDPSASGPLTVSLELTAPTGGASLGSADVSTLTINPSPEPVSHPGQLQLETNEATVTAGSTETLTVNRTGGSDGTVTVNYATVNDSAAAGINYVPEAGMLVFGPGVTSQTIAVPTLVPVFQDAPVILFVELGSPTGGASLGSATTCVLQISPASTGPTSGSTAGGGGSDATAAPPVTVDAAQLESVHPSKKKTASEIVATFSGGLSSDDSAILNSAHLLASGKGKKAHVFTRPIPLAGAAYDPTTDSVAFTPRAGKLSVNTPVELQLVESGILDAEGRPLDDGVDGKINIVLSKGGATITAPRAARPAVATGRTSGDSRHPRGPLARGVHPLAGRA